MRVLVVDDEPDVTELVSRVLGVEGFEVESETGGRAALTRILADPPDLLVLDLMMPDMDGFEVLKLVRLDARGRSLPVLILSARTGHQAQLETLQLGADAYICKPFSPRELVAQVRGLLGGPGPIRK